MKVKIITTYPYILLETFILTELGKYTVTSLGAFPVGCRNDVIDHFHNKIRCFLFQIFHFI